MKYVLIVAGLCVVIAFRKRHHRTNNDRDLWMQLMEEQRRRGQ